LIQIIVKACVLTAIRLQLTDLFPQRLIDYVPDNVIGRVEDAVTLPAGAI
jgi:hypothetical protein